MGERGEKEKKEEKGGTSREQGAQGEKMCKKSKATASHLANLQLSFVSGFFIFFLQPKMPQYICHLLFFQQYFFSQFSFGSRFVCFLVVCLFACLPVRLSRISASRL